jgi:hypothetical protein
MNLQRRERCSRAPFLAKSPAHLECHSLIVDESQMTRADGDLARDAILIHLPPGFH